MNDRAKYKGRMAIYAMAGVYLLAQAYYMYKDIPTEYAAGLSMLGGSEAVYNVEGKGYEAFRAYASWQTEQKNWQTELLNSKKKAPRNSKKP